MVITRHALGKGNSPSLHTSNHSLKETGGVLNMLKEGDKAPSFSLLSDSGEKVSLKDFKGKTVVLYFYPKDMTPGCTLQACDFRDDYRGFQKAKAVVLGISRDTAERHQAFIEKYKLPFPLLSDESGEVCEAYGVWKQKSLYGRKFMGIERTTFVIGPDGKIKKLYPKVKVKGHVSQVLDGL
jgi:thioredoxin-dependent peroxiredoxin